MIQRIALLVTATIGGAAILMGQTTTAQLEGRIVDPSGSAVPGARITTVNSEKGITRDATTDDHGAYTFLLLEPGAYRIAVQKEGFRPVNRTGIVLHVNQPARVDFVIELGTMEQSVSVTADATILNTVDAARGQVIDNQKIRDLPLNGRDYLQLGLLTAGTNAPPPGSRFGGFSASGFRVTHNNYLLDGMDNNSNQQAAQGLTPQVISPSIDAIEEFKVQTSNYSAEFGRNLGGVVNVLLKSGTNQFHGGAFEFLRNEKLDAKNFFDRPGVPTPPYKRNQFGGLLGGPIQRNRTFFFFDYEGTTVRTSNTALSTVATEQERRGDFSGSRLNGAAVRIFDPASYDSATRARQEFPNAMIPANRLDAIGLKAASFYPLPNIAGVNNYFSNPREVQDTSKFDLRIDRILSQKDMLFGRVSWQNYDRTGDGRLPAPAFGGGDDSTTFRNRPRSFVVSYTHTFSPSLFNTFKVGYNRLFSSRRPPLDQDLNAVIGLKGLPFSVNTLALFGVTGFTSIGPQNNNPHDADSQTRQLTDDLAWVRARHTLKAGFNIAFIQAPLYTVGGAGGSFTFNGNFSRQSSNNQFGNPLADLLLGIPFSASVTTGTQANQRRQLYHGYVQDEFKATSSLTLSFGVRYEFNGPWFEKYNHYSNFDLDTNPARPVLVLATSDGMAGRSTVSLDRNNFAPRVGLAYRLGKHAVVRTGYGIYFGGLDNGGGQFLASNPPFTYSSTFSTDSITPAILLRNGFPPGATTSNVSNVRTLSQDRTNTSPYSQQWNFTIQRELAGNLSVEAGYVGSKGNHLYMRLDGNAPEPGPGNINTRRPAQQLRVEGLSYVIPSLTDTIRRQWTANSNYHALQLKTEKRFSSGLSFVGLYVWSKNISDARGDADAGGTSAGGPQNPRDMKAEKSLADEHFPHRFVLTYNYELPFGRSKRYLGASPGWLNAVAGGWAIGGIATRASGQLVTPGVSGNPSNTGSTNRPNATGASPILSSDERSLQRWFKTDAFVPNPPFTFGNVSRNVFPAPHLINFDFAAYKFFQPVEAVRVQIRAEFFNATNTPHFGSPGATLGTAQFGVISAADPGRIIQFGLKINF